MEEEREVTKITESPKSVLGPLLSLLGAPECYKCPSLGTGI
jgi:hypothetical protein